MHFAHIAAYYAQVARIPGNAADTRQWGMHKSAQYRALLRAA